MRVSIPQLSKMFWCVCTHEKHSDVPFVIIFIPEIIQGKLDQSQRLLEVDTTLDRDRVPFYFWAFNASFTEVIVTGLVRSEQVSWLFVVVTDNVHPAQTWMPYFVVPTAQVRGSLSVDVLLMVATAATDCYKIWRIRSSYLEGSENWTGTWTWKNTGP